MRKLFILITAILFSASVFAQSNEYFNIHEVEKYRFSHLEIKTDKEASKFLKKPDLLNFIEVLKIDSISHSSEILNSLNRFNELKEINLKHNKSNINEHTFDSCSEIEILHLTLHENNLNQIEHLRKLQKLQTLYLYITGRPENMNGLKYLPNISEIHIIGDFLPVHINEISDHIRKLNFLHTFGISLDRVTDFPANIQKNRNIGRFCIYDNLSIYNSGGIEDLTEDKLTLMYNISFDQPAALVISYYSNNDPLNEFETAYFTGIFKGEVLNMDGSDGELPNEKLGFIPFRKEFKPDFPSTTEFRPPYPLVKPNEEIFVIDPNVNTVLYSQSGFKLSIAAGSFVNAQGNDIKENVYIRITQIANPVDLFIAGLNLKNSNGLYTSNYLFNIQASTEKNSANLKNGYQMKASLPVGTDSAKSYFFDYESSSWQDLNLYNDVFTSSFTPIDFHKIENSGNSDRVYLMDTSSFDTRFGCGENVYLNDYGNNSQLLFKRKQFYSDLDRTWKKDYNKSGKYQGLKIKKGKAYIRIEKVNPEKRNPNRHYFKVVDKTEKLFPELSPFLKINFNVMVNPANKREFSEQYIKNIKYVDVRIEYKKGNDYCEIKLKSSEGFKIIKAYLSDATDKKNLKRDLEKFEKAYNSYLFKKLRKSSEFGEMNQFRYQEYQNDCEVKIAGLKKVNNYSELKISQLGTFGFFHNLEPQFKTNLIVQYTDMSGLPIDVKELYMIDSRYNTLIRIQAGNLSIDPEFCSYIFATDYNGNLYYANKNDISTLSFISNNSLTYLKLKKVSNHVNDLNAFYNQIKN